VLSSTCYSAILGPNIFLSTLFYNELSLCFYLNVREVPQSHKATGKLTLLCIFNLIFLRVYSKRGNKILCRKVVGLLWFILLLISLPLSAVTKYFNFATFSKKKKLICCLYVVILSMDIRVMNLIALQVSCKRVTSCLCYFAVQTVYSPSATDTHSACLNGISKTVRAKHVLKFYIWVSVHHKSVIYNKPTRCNSGSIVFIKNCKYALHVSDALCVHLQEHYKL